MQWKVLLLYQLKQQPIYLLLLPLLTLKDINNY